MTSEQKRLLDFVRAYFAEHGHGPTIRTLKAALGLTSTSGVAARLKALTEYGFLRRTSEGAGNYVPVEAARIGLKRAATSDLVAELRQRGIVIHHLEGSGK